MLEQVISNKAGWTRVAFGDVVRKVSDKVDPWESGLERYVAGDHMDTDDLRIRRWGLIGDDYLGPAFHMRFKPGHVLYGSRRTYLRKVALADFEGITANTTYVLETKDPNLLMPELLPFIMQTEAFHAHSIGRSKGSVNPYVNFSDIACFEFLLPPLQEQARLVEAHGTALLAINALEDTSNAARNVLSSLLNAISEAENHVKISELIESGTIEPPQDGNHGEKHPKAKDYVDTGIPFVMASDLRNGRIDFDRCKRLEQSVTDELRIGFAKSGDILLSHKGTVGEVAKVGEITTDYVMLTPQVTYYRVKQDALLHPDWLFYIFRSPFFQMQLRKHERQSTRAFVGITAQRELQVPICEISNQETYLEKLRQVELQSFDALKRREALRQIYFKMLNPDVEE